MEVNNIHWTTMMGRLVSCIGSSEFDQEALKHTFVCALTDSFLRGERRDFELMDNLMFDNHGFNGADFDFQYFKTSIAEESGAKLVAKIEAIEWFDKLWEGYPKQQHDGNSVPHRSKKLCLDRFNRCITKHKKTPEQIVTAISNYCNESFANKQWVKGLETILEKSAGCWLDHCEG